MIAVDEATGKIRAADSVRRNLDPQFVLIARTDAAGVSGGSIGDAIQRANAYLQAGADVAFVEGPRTADDLRTIVSQVGGPVLYNQAGNSPRLTTDQLRQVGVALVTFPGAMLRAAMYAMHDYGTDLRNRGGAADRDFAQRTQTHPLANLHAFARFDQVRAWEEAFIPAAERRTYDGSQGYQPPRP